MFWTHSGESERRLPSGTGDVLLQAVTNAAKASRKKICLFMVFFSGWSERVGWTSRRDSDRDGSPATDRDGPRCGKEAGTAFPTSGQKIRLCGWVSGAGHLIGAAVRRLGSMLRALREGFKTNPRLYFSQDCTEPGGCQGFFCFRIAGAEPLAAQAFVVNNPPPPLLRHCEIRPAGGSGRGRV